MSSQFWDLPAEERAAAMESATEAAGVDNFFDLPAAERAAAYDKAVYGDRKSLDD